jgi:hypothetical protein
MKQIIKGSISYCKSCYCMTKSIVIPPPDNGVWSIICGKCGEYK